MAKIYYCLIHPKQKYCLTQQCRGHPWQLEKVFQKTFEPSHFHNMRHTAAAFGEKYTITAADVFLAVKTIADFYIRLLVFLGIRLHPKTFDSPTLVVMSLG